MMAMTSGVNFSGTWKLERNDENFDKFWQAVGVNFIGRKMMGVVKPTMVIQQNGNDFVITTQTPKSTNSTKFSVGEVFEFSNPWTKENQKMSPSWDGDKLVVTPVSDPDKSPTVTREMEGEFLVMTMQKGDVATKRFFKKLE